MVSLLPEMFEQTCRTCLTTNGEMLPIFSSDIYVDQLPMKLMTFTKVEISNSDPLPKTICKKCIFMADSFYCFKEQCEYAENWLKSLIKSDTVNLKKNESSNDENCLQNSEVTNFKSSRDPATPESVSSTPLYENPVEIEYISDEVRIEVENALKRRKEAERVISIEKVSQTIKNLKGIEVVPIGEVAVDRSARNIRMKKDEVVVFPVPSQNKKLRLPLESTVSKIEREYLKNEDFLVHGTRKKLNFSTSEKIVKIDDREVCSELKEENIIKDWDNKNISALESDRNKLGDGDSQHPKSYETTSNTNSVGPEDKNKCYNISIQSPDAIFEEISGYRYSAESINGDVKILPARVSADLEKLEVATDFDNRSNENSTIGSINVNKTRRDYSNSSFACRSCNVSFNGKTKWRKHVATAHENSSTIACEFCNKELPNKRSLRLHIRTHTGDKPFQCPHCDKKFAQRCNLNTHIRCHIDDRRFICPHCGMGFNRRRTRDDHIITHTGVKRHKCTKCDARFTVRSALRRHLWIHTDKDRPYNCVRCKLQFVGLYEFRRHLKTRHGEFVGPEYPRIEKIVVGDRNGGDEISNDNSAEIEAGWSENEPKNIVAVSDPAEPTAASNVDKSEDGGC